jgi:DNA invertase Pin-like site-specific DNA recombinase
VSFPSSQQGACRVAGYARVSTADQQTHGAGLEAQTAAIEAECERRGWLLLGIEQDALSGKSLNRPGLLSAVTACDSGEADVLMVAKLDRLSRSIIDFGALLEKARKRGYNVVALDLGLDLSTPQGELVANVIASVAQWERRIIGQRTKDALAVKRAGGTTLGRPRVLPESVVRRIRLSRARGATFAAIADRLNADAVPTAHGGERWHPATVRSVAMRVARPKSTLGQ